ncbi:MAG: sialidase family protein, partial [Actinomycetota bacterium]
MPTDVFTHDRDGNLVKINGKRGANTAADAVARRTGMDAFEPTLGVSDEGRIYFQAAKGVDALGGTFRFEPHVLGSDDRGRTWKDISPMIGDENVHAYTGDPYLHLDPDTQRVFTVDWVLASYCSQLSFSDDGGETWSSTILDCGGFDHQNVFTGPPSITTPVTYPNLVYYCGQAIPSAVCSKSVDGGRSFVPTGAAAFAEISDVLDCGRSTGHGTVGPKGIVYLPTACDKPYLAVSKDEGASWKVVAVSDKGTNGDHETAVGADDEGNVYYAWIGDDRLPYVSVSEDGGDSWGEAIRAGPGQLR